MFEHRRQPLVSTRIFYERLLRSCGVAGIIVVVSLVCGMAGYHLFEGMSWLDAFVNAAMILSGMGAGGSASNGAG